MSCSTLNQGSTGLQVSMAQLPEGFCPATMQELANAIADRLIVSPNQAFTSFAIGSIEPSSNVGPWLKDCLEWFVFDDATATYIPIRRGFDSLQYFSTAGNSVFIVPNSTYKLKIHAFGGGGGGAAWNGNNSNGGGGGGAYGMSIVNVTPGQSIALTIGAGGAGGVGSGSAPGSTGGSTTILGKTAGGGGGGSGAPPTSGAGGIATGFDLNFNGQAGHANVTAAAQEGDTPGGDAGGWGGKGGVSITNATGSGRGGTAPGGGGSSGLNAADNISGAGAAGGILIEY